MTRKKFRFNSRYIIIPILLSILTLIAVLTVSGKKVKEQKNATQGQFITKQETEEQKTGGHVSSDSEEYLLMAYCKKWKDCSLLAADTEGNVQPINTSKVFETSIKISGDGKHLFYTDDNRNVKLVNLSGAEPRNVDLGKVELLDVYKSFFWIQENDFYRYLNYRGELLRTIPRSLFPWPLPGSDISAGVYFSPVYEDDTLLAYSAWNGGDGAKYTTWRVGSNNELTLIHDDNNIDFNEYKAPRFAYLLFMEHGPGFLAVEADGIYILASNGETKLLTEEKNIGGYGDNYFFDEAGKTLYYRKIAMNPDYYDDLSTYGIYKLDIETGQKKLLIKTADFSTYFKLSPSGDYLVASNRGEKSAPELISTEDLSSVKYSDSFTFDSKYIIYPYGWVTNDGWQILKNSSLILH